MPVFGGPGSGKGGAARADMMKLAFAFDEELSQTNGFSVDRIVVRLKALHTGSSRTNALGEFIDVWGVGYKTVVQNRTNVLIRCAGPNRKFGDNDDIAYDSLSKKFLK